MWMWKKGQKSSSGKAAKEEKNQQEMDRFVEVLGKLPKGSRVGVLYMRGSLCPITLGHVQGFVEARKILLGEPGVARPAQLEPFAEVLGLFSLNGDGHVAAKMGATGDPLLDSTVRRKLVWLAVEDYPWMAFIDGGTFKDQTNPFGWLSSRFPGLEFVRFLLNGADDVLKYRKWGQASMQNRHITMGRPGDTEDVITAAKKYGVDFDAGYFIMGPELPDISSTLARKCLRTGNRAGLKGLLHPRVIDWCFANEPYKGLQEEAKANGTFHIPMARIVHQRLDGITSTILRKEMTTEQRAFTDTQVMNGEIVEVASLVPGDNFAEVYRLGGSGGFVQTRHLLLSKLPITSDNEGKGWPLATSPASSSSSSSSSSVAPSATSSSSSSSSPPPRVQLKDTVELLGANDGWVFVRTRAGAEGWIPCDALL